MSVIEFSSELDRNERLAQLRHVLAEKFSSPELHTGAVLSTGLAAIDEKEGGVRKGAVTEIVGPTSSSALFLESILTRLKNDGIYAALVDAGRSFDPQGSESDALQRLLWVRCDTPKQAVKATDLLLRDGNLPLVMLDFQTVPLREIQRIPASTWHRFQRILEPSDTALVVFSSQPVVQGAQVRIAMAQRWKLEAMCRRRQELLDQITAQVFSRSEFSSLPAQKRSAG